MLKPFRVYPKQQDAHMFSVWILAFVHVRKNNNTERQQISFTSWKINRSNFIPLVGYELICLLVAFENAISPEILFIFYIVWLKSSLFSTVCLFWFCSIHRLHRRRRRRRRRSKLVFFRPVNRCGYIRAIEEEEEEGLIKSIEIQQVDSWSWRRHAYYSYLAAAFLDGNYQTTSSPKIFPKEIQQKSNVTALIAFAVCSILPPSFFLLKIRWKTSKIRVASIGLSKVQIN